MPNKLMSMVKKGLTGIQKAYAQQKRDAEKRAKKRLEAAKTKYEKERIKAELERERLVLQRQALEAKAAVQREKEAVQRVRESARKRGGGSGVGKFLSDTRKSFRKLQRAYYGEPARPRHKAKSAKRR